MKQLIMLAISLISLDLHSEQDESFAFDKSAPLVGSWVGTATIGDTEAFGTLEIEKTKGAFKVRGTLFKLQLKGAMAEKVTIDNSKTSFVFVGRNKKFLFKGAVNSTGQVLKGSVTNIGDQQSDKPQTGVFEFSRTLKPHDCNKVRVYSGAAAAPGGSKIDMALMVATTPKKNPIAWIDVPLLGLKQYPLSNVKFDDTRFAAKLVGSRVALIEARFKNNELSGEFQQGNLALDLKLTIDPKYAFRAIRRPQEPKPPFPYRQREVVTRHPEGHLLAGTLTLPDKKKFGPGPYPAAILISGGGSEDRDCSALGHKPFLVIADYLTRRGIAVMRFDDRGVGKSKVLKSTRVGKDSTTKENSTDTLAVYRKLKEIDEIDRNRIGLIGHSEGGAIAPMVCAIDKSVAFAVLMAGPGVRGDKVFQKQMELNWQLAGADPETVRVGSKLYADLQRLIVQAAPIESIEKSARQLAKFLIENELASTKDETSVTKITSSLLEFNSRWWKFIFSYNPAENLGKVSCPILAMNGTKDCQVEHQQNLNGIQAAAMRSGSSVTIRRYKGRNHLFQRCKSGATSEYAAIETTIDEQVLSDICDWIRKVTQQKIQGKSLRREKK